MLQISHLFNTIFYRLHIYPTIFLAHTKDEARFPYHGTHGLLMASKQNERFRHVLL